MSMIEKPIEVMELNVSAGDKHCETYLQAKQTKSPSTMKLSQLKEII